MLRAALHCQDAWLVSSLLSAPAQSRDDQIVTLVQFLQTSSEHRNFLVRARDNSVSSRGRDVGQRAADWGRGGGGLPAAAVHPGPVLPPGHVPVLRLEHLTESNKSDLKYCVLFQGLRFIHGF